MICGWAAIGGGIARPSFVGRGPAGELYTRLEAEFDEDLVRTPWLPGPTEPSPPSNGSGGGTTRESSTRIGHLADDAEPADAHDSRSQEPPTCPGRNDDIHS